jgi:hypothetical protein
VYPINWHDAQPDTKINDITGLRVVKEFEDDHVPCFDIELTIKFCDDPIEYNYKFDDMWAGARVRKMYYQSEINQNIRNNILAPYLLNKILDQ